MTPDTFFWEGKDFSSQWDRWNKSPATAWRSLVKVSFNWACLKTCEWFLPSQMEMNMNQTMSSIRIYGFVNVYTSLCFNSLDELWHVYIYIYVYKHIAQYFVYECLCILCICTRSLAFCQFSSPRLRVAGPLCGKRRQTVGPKIQHQLIWVNIPWLYGFNFQPSQQVQDWKHKYVHSIQYFRGLIVFVRLREVAFLNHVLVGPVWLQLLWI